MKDEQDKEQKQWLYNVSDDIKKIDPGSLEFMEFEWLWLNREKIIGNKKIIELLR